MSIYVYRLSQWIEKRFNAKGGNVITDFEQAARAVLAFPIGVEERYLQGWNRFAIAVNQAAVAAQNSRVRIRNPVGSNVIAVLEMASFLDATAADAPILTYGAATTDLVTLVSLTFTRMDPRGNPQPTMIVSQNAQAAGGTPNLQRSTTTTVPITDFINNANQEIPILPGQAVDFQSNVVNTAITVSLMWRERALELSELT